MLGFLLRIWNNGIVCFSLRVSKRLKKTEIAVECSVLDIRFSFDVRCSTFDVRRSSFNVACERLQNNLALKGWGLAGLSPQYSNRLQHKGNFLQFLIDWL